MFLNVKYVANKYLYAYVVVITVHISLDVIKRSLNY